MAHESTDRLRVYRRRRWPARFFVILYALDLPIVVATASHADKKLVAGIFGIALAVCLVWLYASERRAIHVRDDGIESVPYFGRAARYPWASIAGFFVGSWSPEEVRWGRVRYAILSTLGAMNASRGGPLVYPHERGGPTVMIEPSHAGKAVALSLTRHWPRHRAKVERICDELNDALHASRPTPAAQP